MSIETPAVIVDAARCRKNLERVRTIGLAHDLEVRPHIKTHKCLEVGRLQLSAGASGITASKSSEARVFVEAGFPSVTVAYPIIDENKAKRLIEAAAERDCDLRFIVDSEPTISAVARAAEEKRYKVGVYIKIDVGLHRVGLKPESEALVPLAQLLENSRSLELIGLLSHAGHAYGAGSLAAIRDIAESERKQMVFAQERLSAAKLPVSKLSVGSTPTVLAAERFDGLTEIRPGSYIFFDLTAVRLGVAELNAVALSVLTSVVSVNEEYTIFDAGSKVLSSDMGPHGTVGAKGFGAAFPAQIDICEENSPESLLVEKLSEEHGFLKSGNQKMAVGDRLRIVPNHCCPVANLARELIWVEEGTEIQHWRVAAAGKVL